MSKYIMTVLFTSKAYTSQVTSQVYHLDYLKQANLIADRLIKDFNQHKIVYSIAVLSNQGEPHVSKNS